MRDLLGALILRIHDDGKPQGLPQKFHLVQILGVPHPGDHVGRSQLPGRDAADHIGLVVLGGGQQQVRVGGPRLPQGLGIGGAALHADHIQRVGHVLDGIRIMVEDGDIVSLLRQKLGHRTAYLPRAGNDDLHSDLSLLSKTSVS